MKAVELPKAYDPKDFEDRVYEVWEKEGMFRPNEGEGEAFTIVMPPPNVTGILHMGHALNNSLQDILTRYYRMTGRPTLWVPGTDHAGIATQNVVERQLAKEGLRRQDLGRDKFLERTWAVKEKHHDIIKSQLEKIGSSCDWEHERFTMDEGLSRAVRESFVTLYERGLIYKGEYLVNYCPKCGTALADDEVEYKELPGKLWDIRYPYSDGSGYITVATTRPETMFGDVAVAVNPDDERYTSLIGTMLDLPLTDRKIPIIADSFVDLSFGTGMVKITPAHDPNDWQCGKRHNLPAINVLNGDGTLNENCPEKYRNLPATDARKLVVEDLRALGVLGKEVEHNHEVGHCYRCSTVIEPYLSNQWFVSMKGMADKALAAWKNDEFTFYPRRWENTYSHWLENIHDWCISRQLWWGHRIPVWYCEDCGEVIVSRDDATECPKCGSKNLRQETDVLDTWFSSWLWPFSTLGWPDKTADLEKFFPTSTLVTGYDIIFFWVARMIMASLEFLGEVPFKDIYITGLVRDKQGRKMSKSLGNGIDPLEVIDQYGADAMKFTLCYMATQGQDILIDMDSFRMGSRFANKIWNAARFLLMNLEGANLLDSKELTLTTMDKWIYNQLNEATLKVKVAMQGYKFNDGAQAIYDFFWNDFCDWYVESAKHNLYSEDQAVKDRCVTILLDLLAESMRLMHPFVSFISEEIYQKLPNVHDSLITSRYPVFTEERSFKDDALMVSRMQEAVTSLRAVRSELGIPIEKKIRVVIKCDKDFVASDFFAEEKCLIASFVNASELLIDNDGKTDVQGAFPVAGTGYESYVFVREAIDLEKEIDRLKSDLQKNTASLEGVLKKLSNEKFLNNAKEEAIAKEQGKKAEFEEKIEKGNKHLALLKSFL
ncbi:valyl-tRNA synthetase [Sphaerochaeta pleomorpha str. Grapes]|uniref:Valine--tRNA ligase n=1 Tax=Sphaerochaeta pleomorpha (strain ATCC BAA-1885 / DSM 22778 / Grapes) TaxID=158190 RepID=G8QTL2_SPHPG|nr:valine--tRNA ligase [Sphaerochaeta pleomorpha]AEV27977.1 valyl-tRNA synthetase [Sphaerochaeta pleomorpha str. Grapes]